MTRNNKKYTIDEKENLIKRMLPPENCSPSNLSIETGISKSTLATWNTKALNGDSSREVGRPKNIISSREKFMIVMETYTLSEIELSNYRILAKENMQHHRGNTRSPERAKIPTTHIATAPNQAWTWDITWLNTYTRGIYFKLYMIIDIFSRKIVGWEVWLEETGELASELASELVERAVIAEKIKGKPLVLHSDNGAPMKSYTLKSKLEFLGVMTSYSRSRVNPYSEAQFETLKYRPGYPQDGFKTIEDAREWVLNFVDWFNNKHYHSGLNFLTPNSRHAGQSKKNNG